MSGIWIIPGSESLIPFWFTLSEMVAAVFGCE